MFREEESQSISLKIDEVKKEMEEYREVGPSIHHLWGCPPPVPEDKAEVLEGIPTSPGIFVGELVVVRGYEDFQKEVEGKILVIPYSDVGWTPLLVQGGSHCIRIRRDFIPCLHRCQGTFHSCHIIRGSCLQSEGWYTGNIDGTNGKLILNK